MRGCDGLQLRAQYRLPLTTWETDQSAAVVNQHVSPADAPDTTVYGATQPPVNDDVIDALVAFRSRVRDCALQEMQQSKREKKAALAVDASGEPRTTPSTSGRGNEAGTALAVAILRECDTVRDVLAARQPACVVRDHKDGTASWQIR